MVSGGETPWLRFNWYLFGLQSVIATWEAELVPIFLH